MKLFTIILKNYRNLLIYLFIILVCNLSFLFIPLVNVFGFEFSIANSILIFFVSGIYTINYYKKREGFIEVNNFVIRKNGVIFSFFLIIPLIVSLAYSSFTMMCSIKDGFLFYIVITLPSLILGTATGLLVVTFFKKFRILIFILVTVLILVIPLTEFYYNPQVFFFNPVLGFFPGTIYDEGIKVSLKLILYRMLNLMFFGSIIIMILNSVNKKFPKVLIAIYSIVISSLFVYFSPVFGFSTTNSSLQKELGVNITTEHFDIHFSARIPNNLVKIITLEHEYDYEQLTNFFKLQPQGKITSYVFDSNEQKGKYFGSVNADVAKPWMKQVYISAGSYGQTLRHELAHVFSAGFGTGIFKVAAGLNPALIEGAAVAAAPFYDDNSIHYMAGLAYGNNYKINIQHLFTGLSFFGNVSSLSYIYAGSFSKFLIERYGINKFERLYSKPDFNEIYNEPIGKITKAYYDFLDSLRISQNIDKSNYYFGRQTIFQKICPRYVGERLETARDYLASKRYLDAEKIFEEILDKTNNYYALIGLSSTLVEMKDASGAAEIIKNNISKFVNTAYYYNLELRLADLEVLNSNFIFADSLYAKLAAEKPNRYLSIISDFRIRLSKDTTLLKKYIKEDRSEKLKILKKINSIRYVYSSIPLLVELSRRTGQKYSEFVAIFNMDFKVQDSTGSYAMLKLSEFMMENLDLVNGRIIAGLAMNFKSDDNFNKILQANFEKANWFYYNADEILHNIKLIRKGK